jgi:2-methylisocitrate lyase-like PEP mutase family enzyme
MTDTKAEQFHALHHDGGILILPNAWDAASAALMADAGAKAVATSSAAVAWARGYPDGDLLPLADLLSTISAVARVAGVPVTADIEGGYTDDLAQLADTIKAVIDAGAVGINLEDGRRAPDLHARKVEAARKAAEAAGVDLFINARVDVYILGLAEGQFAFAETTQRAELYRNAGASGIFVPWLIEDDVIDRLADAIRLPLNVMLRPGLAPAEKLQALGVRRLSSGIAPFRLAYAAIAPAVTAYLETGEASAFASGPLADLNKRFE